MRFFSRSLLALGCSLAVLSTARAETLAEFYALALNNDARLKAAEATYQAGRENENLARAALLPQISGGAQYTKSWGDGTSKSDLSRFFGEGTLPPGTPTESVSKGSMDSDQTGWNVNLQQPLMDFPAWFSFKRGQELTRQAAAEFTVEQEQVILRVAEAYFNVLRAIDNLESSKAEEIAVKRQLEQAQQRFDVGLIAITDVHEARAQYDATVAAKLEAQGALGVAFEGLEQITGQPANTVAPLQERFPIANPDPLDRAAWVDFAVKNNAQLKAATFASAAARENAESKKAAHLPTLTGSLRYGDDNSDGEQYGSGFDQDQQISSAAINLNIPLYSGGATSASHRQAVAQSMASDATRLATQRDVVQATRSLHLSVTTDVARVNARKQAITSAQSALDATRAGYEVGTRNVVDVLLSERTLYQARRNYANARYDYVVNRLKLKQVAGILTPQDVHDLDQWLAAGNQASRSSYETY